MSGPDPAVAAVRNAVADGLADLPDGALVLVACSGGADSLALAAAVAFLAAGSHRTRGGRRLRAGAVVVDHGWHAGSAAVADRAASRCRELSLDPVEVLAVEAGSTRSAERSNGPEADARRARYALLDGAAGRTGAAAVLLGHTLDDQAETVLLGLARGSGARSLAAMAARRGGYRRPLLAVTREQTRRAAAALGLTVWDDPSNADPAYARARLRAAMQTLDGALGPGLPAALARTADLLAEDADCLDKLAEDLFESAVVPVIRSIEGPWPGEGVQSPQPIGSPTVELEVSVLAAAPAALRRRALLLAARRAGSPAGATGRAHVLLLDALLTGWHGQGPVHLPGRVVATRGCGRLVFDRPHGLPEADPEERRGSQ